VDLARGYPRQIERLLRRGAEAHDRRPHRVDGQERHRDPRDRGLVGEDELVEHGSAAPAVFLRPAQRQPAVRAKLADDGAVGIAAAIVALGRVGDRRAHLVCHQAAEVVAQLQPEPFLLGGVGDAHPLSAKLEHVLGLYIGRLP